MAKAYGVCPLLSRICIIVRTIVLFNCEPREQESAGPSDQPDQPLERNRVYTVTLRSYSIACGSCGPRAGAVAAGASSGTESSTPHLGQASETCASTLGRLSHSLTLRNSDSLPILHVGKAQSRE